MIKTDSGWKIVSLDDETVKIMSANFKSVEEEINNSLNNMDGEDPSVSSSNAPEASADDTLNLTTEKFTIKYNQTYDHQRLCRKSMYYGLLRLHQ